jgi:hypothetical protein
MRNRVWVVCLFLLSTSTQAAFALQTLASSALQIEVGRAGGQSREVLSIKVDDEWQPALSAASSVYVRTGAGMHGCPIGHAVLIEGGLLITGDCGIGLF